MRALLDTKVSHSSLMNSRSSPTIGAQLLEIYRLHGQRRQRATGAAAARLRAAAGAAPMLRNP